MHVHNLARACTRRAKLAPLHVHVHNPPPITHRNHGRATTTTNEVPAIYDQYDDDYDDYYDYYDDDYEDGDCYDVEAGNAEGRPRTYRWESAMWGFLWQHAGDCWLLERGDPAAVYSEGSRWEAVTLAAGDLWRDGHARGLILDLDADPGRLAAALDVSRRMRTALSRPRYWPQIAAGYLHHPLRSPATPTPHLPRYAVWSLAVDLCQRATHITHQAGADTNPGDRQRLLAGLDHHLTVTRYGGLISHHKHVNARALPARLAQIDRRHPPSDDNPIR